MRASLRGGCTEHVGSFSPRSSCKTHHIADTPDRLRASGLRVTSGRIAVLDLLARQPTPVSHAELSDLPSRAVHVAPALARRAIELQIKGHCLKCARAQ
jgi:hypothetical protein